MALRPVHGKRNVKYNVCINGKNVQQVQQIRSLRRKVSEKKLLRSMKFCKRRLENIGPALRAMDLLPDAQTFVDPVLKKKMEDTKTMSFDYLKSSHEPLLDIKGAYFISFVKPIESSLTTCQTDCQ